MIGHFERLRATGRAAISAAILAAFAAVQPAGADPARWRAEWAKTDFSRSSVDFASILSGGPPKDGIPSIDNPKFEKLAGGKASGWSADIGDTEAVI